MRAKTLTLKRARRLRREMTPPEVRLWARLRTRSVDLPVFRRQHPEEPYILDFYCADARLAVEVDGEIHGHGDQPERDARRDAWLAERGIEVLRISGADVMRDPDSVAGGMIRLALDRIGGRSGHAAARPLRHPRQGSDATSPVR